MTSDAKIEKPEVVNVHLNSSDESESLNDIGSFEVGETYEIGEFSGKQEEKEKKKNKPSQQVAQKLIDELGEINLEEYKFIGIQCGLNPDFSELTFNRFLNKVIAEFEEKRMRVTEYFKLKEGRIRGRLADVENKLQQTKDKLQDHLSGIGLLKLKVNQLEENWKGLKEELSNKRLEYAANLQELIAREIEETKLKIEEIVDAYKKLFEVRQSANLQAYEDSKGRNQKLLERLSEQEKRVNSEFEQLSSKVATLYLNFASERVANWIVGLSVIISVVFGVLFFTQALHLLDMAPKFLGALGGFLLTLIVGGMTYFYHAKVVEPRIEKNRKKGIDVNFFRQNIELTSAGLMLWASFLLLLMVTAFNQGMLKNTLVSIFYAALILGNGYILGYGYRMRSLLRNVIVLQDKIFEIREKIVSLLFPEQVDFSSEEREKFRSDFMFQLDRMYELLRLKSNHPRYAFGYEKDHTYIPWYWRVIRFFWNGEEVGRRVFYYNLSEPMKQEYKTVWDPDKLLSEDDIIRNWERRIFPKEIKEIEELKRKVAFAEQEYKNESLNLELLMLEKSDYCIELKSEIKRLEDSCHSLKLTLEKMILEKADVISRVEQTKTLAEAMLRRGVLAGSVYRKEVKLLRGNL